MVKTNYATIMKHESEAAPKSTSGQNPRSQSLDRLDEHSGSDSKVERKANRQIMNLV